MKDTDKGPGYVQKKQVEKEQMYSAKYDETHYLLYAKCHTPQDLQPCQQQTRYYAT
jgi:hypothetical protein